MRDAVFRSDTPPKPPDTPPKPPDAPKKVEDRPEYFVLIDDIFTVREEGRIRFRVRALQSFLFDEDLNPQNEFTPEVSITNKNMRNHLHGKICKGLSLCRPQNEGEIKRVNLGTVNPDHSTDLFVQETKSAMCSAYATWQLLYSALWEDLDDWTRTFLNSLIQYQNYKELGGRPGSLPPRIVRTALEARPDIMHTYHTYYEHKRRRELKELKNNYRQRQADLAADNTNNKAELKALNAIQTELTDLNRLWEMSIGAVPWNGSFIRLLRAHLTWLTNGPRLNFLDYDVNTPLESLYLDTGLNILSLPIFKSGEKNTWQTTVSTVYKFTQYLKETNKGIVRGCCVRCEIVNEPEFNHFITYINNVWYDSSGTNGTKTEEFTDLTHFKRNGTITDLHIIVFKEGT